MKKIGQNIARIRKEKGLSQAYVAQYLDVSRQAVAKWESNITSPNSYNLVELAKLFDVKVDVLLESREEKILPIKTPWIFLGLSLFCMIIYLSLSIIRKNINVEVLICLYVVCFPICLFIHLYTTYVISNNAFESLAGFDAKIEYDFNALKRMLFEIDILISMQSFLYIFLLSLLNCFNFHLLYFNIFILMIYAIQFILTLFIILYKSSNSIYLNDIDKKYSSKKIPLASIYVGILFIGNALLIFLIIFKSLNLNQIMILLGCDFLAIILATISFFILNNSINKAKKTHQEYKLTKGSILLFVLSLICNLMMLFI